MTECIQPIERVPALIRELYAVVAELTSLFPGRPFTLDGHLVGSIGDVTAASRYGLTLHTASQEAHDGSAPDGRLVQVKATQATSIGLRAEPEHLIVLKLNKDGEALEAFNGPGAAVWVNCGAMQKNGQRAISLSKLRKLMEDVSQSQRLPRAD
jgi:hypothetical protein